MLTLSNIILRILKAAIPLSQLYVGKLIIDEVIRLISVPDKDFDQLWTWLAFEFGLAILS